MFNFYQRQLGEETESDDEVSVEDEIITDDARQAMDQEKLDEINEFITVVDKDSTVDFD
jgi:archaellum component FlaC